MAVDVLNTKFTDIDVAFVKEFLRIEPDFTEDDIQLQLILDGAKSFIITDTQKTEAELDEAKHSGILLLKAISDFYHNRSAEGDPFYDLIFKSLRNYNLGTPEQ